MTTKIQQLVERVVRHQDSKLQFGLNPIQRHIHNGIDSLPAFEPTRIYSGFVPSDADMTGSTSGGFQYLPAGWTVELNGGGYLITHNLGSDKYAVMISMLGISALFYFPATLCRENNLSVVFFNTAGSIQPMDFNFELVHINNKNLDFPLYTANE